MHVCPCAVTIYLTSITKYPNIREGTLPPWAYLVQFLLAFIARENKVQKGKWQKLLVAPIRTFNSHSGPASVSTLRQWDPLPVAGIHIPAHSPSRWQEAPVSYHGVYPWSCSVFPWVMWDRARPRCLLYIFYNLILGVMCPSPQPNAIGHTEQPWNNVRGCTMRVGSLGAISEASFTFLFIA